MGRLTESIKERFSGGGVALFVFFGVAASIISVFFYIARPEFLTLVDLKATDLMFRARPIVTPTDKVVVVAVDEKSVNELGRWPWSRTRIASLIKGLNGAKVIAFDMVFSEAEDSRNDAALAAAVKESGNVVLGYFFRDDSTEKANLRSLSQVERSVVKGIRFTGQSSVSTEKVRIPKFSGIETNIADIGEGASGFGSFNILPGKDGTYRVANLVYRYGDNIYPTLAVESIIKYAGSDAVLTVDPYGFTENVSVGDYTIPLDERGGFMLNFYGPGGTFKTYPATDVINGRLPQGLFDGKIVFVGVTEKAVYDLRVTSVDPVYPGVEVHATVAGNVLERRFLVNDFRTIILDVVSIIVFTLILSFLLSRIHRAYFSLLLFALSFAAVIVIVYYLFSSFNMVLSVTYPALSLSLGYLFIEAYRNFVVEKKSRFYRKAFSTYVPPQVVNEIIKDPGKLKLGGEKRVITILFSDIRGFTTLAESVPPEKLVSLLNEYLTPMTEIVFKEEGTLDKYIGDAIMAIFNAPHDIKDHPRRACTVALNMAKKMPELNAGWQKRGLPELSIGIGVNTGEAVVGNMGAELRFDYTAIGDAVNLASRLEGMNKIYSTGIVVSESTSKACNDDFIFRELDYVRAKGKEKPVAIYELMDFKTSSGRKAELSLLFKEALVNYRKGKFKTARIGFEDILAAFTDDGPSRIYIERCEEFILSPPPADWNGVYEAKTK